MQSHNNSNGSEDDGLLGSEDPRRAARIKRLREASRFRGDDKILLLFYVAITLSILVAYFKMGPTFPKMNFNLMAVPDIQEQTLNIRECPAMCGKGFHHSYDATGEKVLSDCFADDECSRTHMDVAADRAEWHIGKDPAQGDRKILVIFAMKQKNLAKLEDRLYEIADPKHPDYGKWLSQEEVDEMTAPLPHRVEAVKSWVRSFGFDESEIKHESANADFLSVHATVRQANAMFDGTFHEFTHRETGQKLIRLRDDSYSLPDFVADHVDFVTPNVRFHVARKVRSDNWEKDFREMETNPQSRYRRIPTQKTPKVLSTIYSLPNGRSYPGAQPGQKQAFLELIGGRYSEQSVRDMERHYHVRHTKLQRYPADQRSGNTDESILDATCMAISSSGVTTIGFQPGKDHFFLHFALELRQMHPAVRPQVASISYSSDEQSDGKLYVLRANYEFMKLTAQGMTFVASSGDYGVKGIKHKCFKGNQFIPSFPASSPFVVGVGGTARGYMNPKNTQEDAWVGSGGGFSVWMQRPRYQHVALTRYLQRSRFASDSQQVNILGAGYPDIAASAGTYPMWVEGFQTIGGGTSASGPFIAGVVSMLNAYRMKEGKPVLGFVHPLLYHMHALDQVKKDGETKFFHDVTRGATMGCYGKGDGFSAVPGWDPTTGVGTPNVQAMLEFLQSH